MPLPSRPVRRRVRYADVASTRALLLAMGGTAYAATLPTNSVGNAQLRNDAVTAAKIRADSVGTSEIAEGAVRGTEVAAESLTLAHIVGADMTGKLSFSVGTWACDSLVLNVPSAKAGQVALFSFTAPDALPDGVATSVPAVSDGKVKLVFCNGDNTEDSPIEVTDAPFRIVTFG